MAKHLRITLCSNCEVLGCEPEHVEEILKAGTDCCYDLTGRLPESDGCFRNWHGNGPYANGRCVSIPDGYLSTGLGDIACEIQEAMDNAKAAAAERDAKYALQELDIGCVVTYNQADILGEKVIRDAESKLKQRKLCLHDDGSELVVCWMYAANGDLLFEPAATAEQPAFCPVQEEWCSETDF